MGRCASSAAVASESLMFTKSRTFDTVVPPTMSLISPTKSMSVCSAPPRLANASSRPGILIDDGNEILGAIELEVIDLHGDGELGHGILEHQRIFKLALLVDGSEFAEFLVGVIALAIIELGFESSG